MKVIGIKKESNITRNKMHNWVSHAGLLSQKKCTICGCIKKGITKNRITTHVYILKGITTTERPDCTNKEFNNKK